MISTIFSVKISSQRDSDNYDDEENEEGDTECFSFLSFCDTAFNTGSNESGVLLGTQWLDIL